MIATLTVDGVEVALNGDPDGVASVLNDLLDTDTDAEPDAGGRLPEWYLRVLSSAYTARRKARESKGNHYGSDDLAAPLIITPEADRLSTDRLDELGREIAQRERSKLWPGVDLKDDPGTDPFDE